MIGYCDYDVCGDCNAFCNDGVSAGIWVIHTGPKSGGQTLACILSKMCYYIPSFMIGYCDYDV